jgi:putative redox protein
MDDPWRTVNLEWKGDLAFDARNSVGATVQLGSTEEQTGLSPMEMLLAAMAGCTGADVASILGKMRQPLERFQVQARGKRAQDHPRVYTEIEVDFIFWGSGLEARAVETAIQLSQAKYCSASAMLGAVARIRTSFRILAPGEQLVSEPV